MGWGTCIDVFFFSCISVVVNIVYSQVNKKGVSNLRIFFIFTTCKCKNILTNRFYRVKSRKLSRSLFLYSNAIILII